MGADQLIAQNEAIEGLKNPQIFDPLKFLNIFKSESTDALSDLFESIHCEAFTYTVETFTGLWTAKSQGIADAVGYYVIVGGARLVIASGDGVDLHPGDHVIVAPKLAHRLQGLEAGRQTLIGRTTYGLDVVRAQPLLRTLPPFFVLQGQHDDVREHTALAYFTTKLRNDSEHGNQALMRRLTEALFIFSILSYRRKQAAAVRETPIDPSTLRIAPSLQAIHRHPEKDWTLSTLAKESGLSRSLFCAEFSRTIGETPTRYLTQIRMSLTQELLRHSRLSLAAIAFRVGYRDVVTLGRAFKRHFGTTLGAFRDTVVGRTVSDMAAGQGKASQ